ERRIVEDHVVEHVDEVSGKSEPHLLGDIRLFADRPIQIPAAQTAQNAIAVPCILRKQNVAEAIKDLLRVGEEIKPRSTHRKARIGARPDAIRAVDARMWARVEGGVLERDGPGDRLTARAAGRG